MNPFQKKKNKTSIEPVEGKFMWTRFIDIPLLLINLAVVAALVFADSACCISPVKFTLPSYFGLAFPIVFFFTLSFLVFWIVRRKWYFVISLTALLISYQNVQNTFPLSRQKEIPENSIKILSYNVHLFNFYTQVSKNKVIDYIVDSEADIVCLQEFGYSTRPQKEYLKKNEILDKLTKKYPHYHIEAHGGKNGSYGVATFSKFPISQNVRIEYQSKYNLTIYSDMLIHGKMVRVFNCHLESNHLTEDDKELLKNLGEEYKNDRINEVVEKLSQKLNRSYKVRAKQADVITQAITETDLPVIVCGDFNDVPVSYSYAKIKGDRLSDAFSQSGSGYGYTFNEKMFWFRIDHILCSKEFSALNFNIEKVNYSDHYPVECYLELKN